MPARLPVRPAALLALALATAPAAVAQLAEVDAPPARTTSTLSQLNRTALHEAARRGDMPTVTKLIAMGADVHARDANGETPLFLAARLQRAEAVLALIDAGADATAVNNNGLSALWISAAEALEHADPLDPRLRDIAEALIDAGADPNFADANGVNVLRLAIDNDKPMTVAVLEARGAVASPPIPPIREELRSTWPTFVEIETRLQALADLYPGIAQKVVIGQSVQGRNISAVRLSDNVGVEEDEAELSYISTMHGDEIVGVETCLRFAELLCASYQQPGQERLTCLIDDFDIWILPVMNPDGYDRSPRSRFNANGVDLNRNFPDPFTSPSNTPAGRQQETAVVMNWRFGESFVLSANLHGGALLVNYPFDNNPSGSSVYTACPDDDVFIAQSLAYSTPNIPMFNSPSFPQGITNGADWFAISGGMQDWNYRYLGCNEVTLELSNVKQPTDSQIDQFWDDNRESMIAYFETAYWGVRGIVTDSQTGLPIDAAVTVVGRDHLVFTDPDIGDYHRMLLDGTYDLLFEADGYEPVTALGVVVSNASKSTTRLDIQMDPTTITPTEVASPNGGESFSVGENVAVTWTGPATSSFQVQQTPDFGTATTLDGFETGSLDPAYTTSGDADWFVQSSDVLAGSFAAESGNIGDNDSSILERTVQGPGTVSFFYQVSSEATYDFFRFLIDGNEEVADSGSTGWIEVIRPLGPGPHTLRWVFDKDISVSNGDDAARIDEMKFVEDSTQWFDIVAQTGPGQTSVNWNPALETTTGKVRVRKVQGPGVFGDWDDSNAVFSVVPSGCVGDVDGDGDTDVFDFADMAANFGAGPGATQAQGDVTGDGFVDVFDFADLAADFGCAP